MKFKKESDTMVMILDETTFKVAQFRISANEKHLVNVVRRDVRDVPPEGVPPIVQETLAEFNVKKPRVVLAVPASFAITKNIEIPSLDQEEIRSIIDLQAGRHTPYPREEILVGYITIGVFQRNYTKVLLVLVNRTVIKKQLGLLAEAGVRVVKVVFSPEASARFYAEAMQVKEEDIPVGIIDIAGQSTLFLVEFNKTVAMCRNIPLGLAHLIKEGAGAREKLLTEIAQSLETYQSEDINRLPESFVLTSDDAKIKDLQPDLQTRLKANIKMMPYRELVTGPEPLMHKMASEYPDDSFLDVVAAALTGDKLLVDLTPEEVKTEQVLEEKGKEVVKASVLAVVLLILICGIFFSKLYFKSLLLEKVEEEYTAKRKAVLALDRIDQRTRIVKAYVNSRMVSLDVLGTLYTLIPNEIYLDSITLEDDGSISIQGVSESMSRVFNFVTRLEESEIFKNVKTKSTTAKKDRGKDVAAFEIAFRLESAPDDEQSAEEGDASDDGQPAGKKGGNSKTEESNAKGKK